MAKRLSIEEKVTRQLQLVIKNLAGEGQRINKDSDQFEEKLGKIQDKVEDLKDRGEISSAKEHELKEYLGKIEEGARGREAASPQIQLSRRIREVDRELRALEGKIAKDGEKSDPVEDGLDEVEEKINELKKSGAEDKETIKKIKRLEDALDRIK